MPAVDSELLRRVENLSGVKMIENNRLLGFFVNYRANMEKSNLDDEGTALGTQQMHCTPATSLPR
jgi:hypothetical protein